MTKKEKNIIAILLIIVLVWFLGSRKTQRKVSDNIDDGEIYGCMDMTAFNYYSAATIHDESKCVYGQAETDSADNYEMRYNI